jgi:23S rRNA (cytidine1920-2'-O)/16S rRNA (cytidine1409-2'-O)-methyltransferase
MTAPRRPAARAAGPRAPRTPRARLDVLLVERGLAPGRDRARALVMAREVLVDGAVATRPAAPVALDAAIAVKRPPPYVGRGGEKLAHALARTGVEVAGRRCLDVGASTGGFTDCLLQHGASRVYAVDVGKGQLDYGLRNDPRVVVMEGVNARHLEALPEPVDVVTIDVSFISLTLVLPVVETLFENERRGEACLAPTPARGTIVALFKPQFEAAKDEVPRGGVITDPQLHARLIGRFAAWCVRHGFRVLGLAASPILGAQGNREFLFWLRPPAPRPAQGAASPPRRTPTGGEP